jgi:hypothetical protein
MAISLKLTGASFRKPAASIALPDRRGLIYEFVFGGSLARTRVNLATGKDTLVQVGSPVFNSNSVTIGSGNTNENGFSGLWLPPTLNFSIVTIRKKPATYDGASVFHSPDGSLSVGFLGASGNTYLDFWNTRGVAYPDTARGDMPTHTNFFFQAGVGPDQGLGKLFVGTGGTVTKSTATQPGTDRYPTPLCIGGNGGVFGTHEIAYAAMFGRLLSDSEVGDIYASLKAWGNNFLGITVS